MSQSSTDQGRMPDNMQQLQKKSRFLIFGVVIAILIIAATVAFAYYSINKQRDELWSNIDKDLRNMAFGRANEVNNWLKTMLEPANRFADAGSVKQFAEEILKMDDNLILSLNSGDETGDIISQRMDLMRSYLTDIVKDNEFRYGGMTNRKGDMYLYTDPARNTLNLSNQRLAQEVARTGEARFSSIESDPQYGLSVGVFLPIKGKDASGEAVTAAVLFLAKPVGPKLRDLFTFSGYSYSGKGYNASLLQKHSDGMQIVHYNQDSVRDVKAIPLNHMGNIEFAKRISATSNQEVLSMGAKVMLVDWWVLMEQNYTEVQKVLDERTKDICIMTGLVALVLILLLAAAWWWLVGHERTTVLNQFKELFQVIEEQKRLLDSINSTISDPISLTDTNGVCLYVNRAFAQSVGRDAKDVPGLDIAAVFGFDTAKRLNSSDQHVLMTSEGVTINEVVWLQSRRHYFQISKSPLRESGNRTPVGIVSVFRDMTKVVETEERSRRMVQQTIDALVQAIEKTDPFLGGHSRIMGEVATLISWAMNLSERDTATVSAAATLSQIGKMYVPREIITKPGVLTEDEKRVMEQHVEHTKSILSGIEFDLPVLDAIEQMNERLDGKGYPLGLHGDEIKIYGRVLAVANAFTAMARPRSYRPAMDAATVLSILERESGSYDQHIVQVLREVLQSPAGERVVETAAQSQAV